MIDIEDTPSGDVGEIKTNNTNGFFDPRGEFPRPDYFFKPSLNKEAIGEIKDKISLGGGDPTISFDGFDVEDYAPSQYGKVQVQETAAGHKIILDDTPGSQRVVIKHGSGAGIEFKSDGGINIRSKNNMAVSIDANGIIILEGDLRISSKNLSVDVTGDLDMRVDGDYNLTVSGDHKENIAGSYRTTVDGNRGEIVKGNNSNTVLGASTTTVLGSSNNIVKGAYNYSIGGSSTFAIGSEYKFTAQGEIVQSAPSISISAGDITVVGAAGTIGGQEVTYYGNTFHAARVNAVSMHATTFHGDLNGTALQANATSSQNYGEAATSGSAFSYTSTTADNDETSLPTEALLGQVLTNSSRGIRDVSIDEKNYIYNKIDRSVKMGGVANKKLTVREVRTKLKDPAHQQNTKFIQSIIADGVLSHNYFIKVPPGVGRSYRGKGTVAFIPAGSTRSISGSGTGKFISGEQAAFINFNPDSKYDPQSFEVNTLKDINSKTLLGNGLPLSTFLAGPGFATNLGHIATIDERLALARQLVIQAEVIKLVRKNEDKFKDFRIVVVEGVYKPLPAEELTTGSILDLARKGLAITYELYDEHNKIYPEITYEFAEYLAEYLPAYDKIILNYDNIDRNAGNQIHSQLTVIMPEVDREYKIASGRQPRFQLETYFNNKIMSNTDLVEIDPFANPEKFAISTSTEPNIIEYRLGEIRNRPVKPALERILAQAARTAKIDKVIITSGMQPGTSGKRIGSTRHDTGMAADLYLQIGGEDVTLDSYKGRETIERFVRAAVKLGIRAGGMSQGYMGNKVMHLDTLGASLGSGRYNDQVATAWKSDNWFASAIKSA